MIRKTVSRIACFFVVLAATAATPAHLSATQYTASMFANDDLFAGDSVISFSGNVLLHYDDTYALLRLDWIGPGEPYLIWATNTDTNWPGPGTHTGQSSFPAAAYGRLIMQGDGNLVLYSTATNPYGVLWATNTADNADAELAVQDDTNMVIYSATSDVLWAVF